MPLRTVAVFALPFVVAGCATPPSRPSTPVDDVPAALAVPAGTRLAVTLKADGLQNYECRMNADSPTGYAWVFVAPEAALRDGGGALVGRHYAGPTWEHADGSKVVGRAVATAAAPQAGDIPWLLLQGTPAATPGAFARVTYIQRIRTVGGAAPAATCGASTIGTKSSVRYTANYLFYEG